jgi:hypothetical protein
MIKTRIIAQGKHFLYVHDGSRDGNCYIAKQDFLSDYLQDSYSGDVPEGYKLCVEI